MQTSISYLKNHKSGDQRVRQRLQSLADRPLDPDGTEESSPEALQTRRRTGSSRWLSLFAKIRHGARLVYKWFTRALLLGMLILLVGLVKFLWMPSTQTTVARESESVTRMTARNSYVVARPVAQRWAPDAQLIALSATWEASQSFQVGEGDWSLTFYSAANSATALVSVIHGRATLISARDVTERLNHQPMAIWQLDSPAVVAQLRDHGGGEFLRSQPGAILTMSLNLLADGEWKARFIHQDSRREFAIHLDPDSGAITDLRQTG